MDSHSTSSSADEQGKLHADDTQVENLDVLQPGESPPRSIGLPVKSRGAGSASNQKGGKPPVPTTVEYADIPTRHIAVKADTPKKREESRKNDVLVEQQMKATRINTDARLDSIARRVHSIRHEPPRPVASTADAEPVDWGVVAVGAAGAIILGVSVYFLIKSLIGSNVGSTASPAAAPTAALPGAYPAPGSI